MSVCFRCAQIKSLSMHTVSGKVDTNDLLQTVSSSMFGVNTFFNCVRICVGCQFTKIGDSCQFILTLFMKSMFERYCIALSGSTLSIICSMQYLSISVKNLSDWPLLTLLLFLYQKRTQNLLKKTAFIILLCLWRMLDCSISDKRSSFSPSNP